MLASKLGSVVVFVGDVGSCMGCVLCGLCDWGVVEGWNAVWLGGDELGENSLLLVFLLKLNSWLLESLPDLSTRFLGSEGFECSVDARFASTRLECDLCNPCLSTLSRRLSFGSSLFPRTPKSSEMLSERLSARKSFLVRLDLLD